MTPRRGRRRVPLAPVGGVPGASAAARAAVAAAIAGILALALAVAPVTAHGDHDARALARGLAAGPYTVSIWQVYPDMGASMAPVLIVMLDGLRALPAGTSVSVTVNGEAVTVHRSTTTPNGWETMSDTATWDVVNVTISEGGRAWALGPVVVGPPPTSILPMRELVLVSMGLTAVAALWALRRMARAWRRPAVLRIDQMATDVRA